MKKTKLFLIYAVAFIYSISLLPTQLLNNILTAKGETTANNASIAIDYDAPMQTDSIIVTLTIEETKKTEILYNSGLPRN